VVYFQDRLDGGVVESPRSRSHQVEPIADRRRDSRVRAADCDRRTSLSFLLGRTPGPIARGTTVADAELGPAPAIPPGLPASLLERRPDVVQAEQLLVRANANVGAPRPCSSGRQPDRISRRG
jgi:multidrug efflux system outer membrane protein